ncbi:eukaryotic translation initiation factor 4E type 2-like isoform X2 [Physella acuta]|uniref:eukaryotic translation initiation factor 4E type 2-like isoform X2 n=1 Tax=Physella acuta TaxID=109671 RepID=UPI0027DB0871|nr:eukaryotic translation initiation factor 4E type 2-like isoform X2 [Physella acuta]
MVFQSTQKNLSQEMERLKAEDSGDEEEEPFRPAPKPGEGEHPLQYNYAIWFSRRSQSNKTVRYDQNLKFIASFASVEQFWNIYSYITRPSDMTGHVDYHLFKEGIRPMWEDEANKHGGKWIIRLKKGLASRCWENLIMAMLGEQFMVGEEICGAVISIRYQDDILSLWNRSNDQSVTTRIRDILQRVLNLPPNTIMEYKAHTESMKDNTSFRNTDLFVR